MAALIGVQFREVLGDLNPKPPVIVDITTSWAQRYIVKAAALDVMEVYSNHTFQPKKTMNRAELAETLVRLIDVLKKERGQHPAPDPRRPHPHRRRPPGSFLP